MQRQLQEIITEFDAATARLHSLRRTLAPDAWARRPSPGSWSAAECVAHLNLTSAAMIPLVWSGLDEARKLGPARSSRYRRDFMGWMIWRSAGPSSRFKVKTTAPFVPTSDRSPDAVISEFDRLQADQIACVREADGLPIDRVKMTSPFNAKLRYNLFAALAILPRHEHRHLQQAERASYPIGFEGSRPPAESHG